MSLAPPKTTKIDILSSIAAGCISALLLLHNGADLNLVVCGAALGLSAVGLAATDRKRFVIPDHLTVIMSAAGLLSSIIQQNQIFFDVIITIALRALACGGVVWLVRETHRIVRNREGLGFGDVKLALAAGFCLDFTLFGTSLSAAALCAGLYAAHLTRNRGVMRTRPVRIPFGAFWAPTIWLLWLFQQLRELNDLLLF